MSDPKNMELFDFGRKARDRDTGEEYDVDQTNHWGIEVKDPEDTEHNWRYDASDDSFKKDYPW